MTTTTDPPELPIRELIQAILQKGTANTWADWIPLSIAAVEAPDNWIDAFVRLRMKQQFDLLNIMADPAAGPVADALLLQLAAQAHRLDDDQVRQNTLDYAATAFERRTAQLNWLEDQLQPLTAAVENANLRMKEGFDLAGVITQLEKQLTEIRRQDNLEDRFNDLHALESKIIRLETFRRSLQRYESDRPKREAYLDDLKQETEKLRLQKEGLEETVTAALVEVNRLREETKHQEKSLAEIQHEKEKLMHTQADLAQRIASLREEQASLTAEKSQREKERQAILGEFERLQRDVAERDNIIRTERKNLETLRIEAERSQSTRLLERIDEIYALLPQDRADEALHIR